MKALHRTCVRQTICSASCKPRSTTTARNFRSSTILNNEQFDFPHDPPTVSDAVYSDVQIDHQNKTVKTATGELPISPLMDSSFHMTRRKFIEPKPAHSGYKRTKFQQHLARNPYARALATPVRRCPITNTSLPNFFLERFNLVSHPETGKPWFVPENPIKKASNLATATEDDIPEEGRAGPEPDRAAEDSSAAGQQSAAKAQKGVKMGPSAYVLSRQTLLQELQNPQSPHFRGERRLLRMSDHGQSKLTAALNAANWRSDMDAVLLEVLRRRAVEGLQHFANMVEDQGRKYIVKCESWSGIKELKHRGCLLYLGPPEGASPESEPERVPPRLSTMNLGPCRYGATIAVHNLRELLGEEHVSRLRQGSAVLSDGSLFLLGRQATVNLQMLLWKLQGYMAWSEQQVPSGTLGSK